MKRTLDIITVDLQNANEDLRGRKEAAEMAIGSKIEARERVDELQKEFDEAVTRMKHEAPDGTRWNR